MTNYVPSASFTNNAGSAYDLVNGDDLYVGQGIQIASTNSAGVFAGIGNNQIICDGTIVGNFGIGLSGGNSSILVGDAGRVIGFELGIYAYKDGGVIYNDGKIHGGGVGIDQVNHAFSKVFNSGTITSGTLSYIGAVGENAAVHVKTSASTYLENTGTIEALLSGSYSFLSEGLSADELINKGSMVGGVSLGSNSDLYDGRGGIVHGTVWGGAGQDTLFGGDFVDVLDGGTEKDVLDGGAGNDVLNGGGGADIMLGGQGSDTLLGGDQGTHVDVMFGGAGDDAYQWDGLDLIGEAAGQGSDTIYTVVSNFALDIGLENVKLYDGFSGAVTATGNANANVLIGNQFGNVLSGLGGNDTLYGGAGGDYFLFETGPGADSIMDFNAVEDQFILRGAAFGFSAGQVLQAGVNFFSSAAPTATAAIATILHNTSSGGIFLDPDGSGSNYAPILFAGIGTSTVSAMDFMII